MRWFHALVAGAWPLLAGVDAKSCGRGAVHDVATKLPDLATAPSIEATIARKCHKQFRYSSRRIEQHPGSMHRMTTSQNNAWLDVDSQG